MDPSVKESMGDTRTYRASGKFLEKILENVQEKIGKFPGKIPNQQESGSEGLGPQELQIL